MACYQMFGRRPFAALACAACGTHRVLPRALPDQAAAQSLYNEYLGADVADADREAFVENMLRRLAETGVTFARGQRVLDVGCGSGFVLETICRRFGCLGRGIDVDRRRIERAKAMAQHATFECELFDGTKTEGQYDALLSFAVIEHVVAPVGFLKQFNSALAPGGSLFLLTPNARSVNYRLLRSWWRELLSIGEHIYLFTPESLERCAGLAGFRLVKACSDFDWAMPRVRFDSVRNSAVSLWAVYCALIKRFSACFASSRTGDILYAHFKKV